MTIAAAHRRALLSVAVVSYGVVFALLLLFERPGLGIGHCFYIPIVLVALATSTGWGALAGLVGTGLYALGIVVSPRVPATDAFTVAMAIRLVTFSGVGAVVGWYGRANRGLVERLTEQAERDFLTGLANARSFDERLARRCGSGAPFVLLLGDMDNLKRINDAHGHTEGNRAIGRVAEALTQNLQPGDEIARIGGDEFALLTATPPEEAMVLAGRLVRALEREGLEISFGWAASGGDGTGPVELFRKADDRLYAAKLLSRNRHAVAPVTAVTV